MKLRRKVFLIFIFLSVTPLFLITFIAYNRYITTTNQRISDLTSNMFDNVKTELNNTISTIKQTTGLFTFYSDGEFSIIENLKDFSDPTVTHTDYEALRANENIKFVCQNILYSYDYIYGLYVFTPSGVILDHQAFMNGSVSPDYNPENDEWYQETMRRDGRLYISSVAYHDLFSGDKTSIFFAQKLQDVYTHQFLGVLVIDCDPALFDISSANTYPEVAHFTLTDTCSGNVLYTDSSASGNTSSSNNNMIYESKLKLPDLKLTAEINYSLLFHEYNFTGIVILAACSVCLIGIILISLVFSRSLTYPIEHLSRKMSQQSGKHLTATSRYLDRSDEIGTLYNEYNNMIEELNTSIKRDYQNRLITLDAQMKSLEARINSHFLFNTLESINSMAELYDNSQIATMSMALGNMFRYSIKTPSELVTVADELKHVNDYVSIQQIRFDNKFRVEIRIPNEIRQRKVLKLILQPLVENALYHGLGYCTEGDLIQISGHEENGLLFLIVEDNGKGMSPEELCSLKNQLHEEARFTELGGRGKYGIGLTNIHTRIELYYGRGYGLSIKSEKKQGTQIKIKLPDLSKEEN